MSRRKLTIAREAWPIAGTFTIARGSKTEAEVVVATLREGDHIGRGECVPYRRYGETVDGVIAALESLRDRIEDGTGRLGLQALMPPGAARHALDGALLDLEAKTTGRRAFEILGLAAPKPQVTCYTISLAEPEAMAIAAAKAAHRPLLKIKLGRGLDDLARLEAVRHAAPDARLVVDANEGWTLEELTKLAPDFATRGVEMIEQPLKAGEDQGLAGFASPLPLCADESAHGLEDLDLVAARYQALNLKLDKTGGVTAGLDLARAAQARGLKIMLGCMVGTSLSMAPASLLMDFADWVDLDGPLLLAQDREPGLSFAGDRVHPPDPALWG